MKRAGEKPERCPTAKLLRRTLLGASAIGLFRANASCSSNDDNSCTTPDQDGFNGGYYTELVSVSDTAFTVGGVDSGSTEPNIPVENLGIVTLTLTNTGTKPHDLVVQCIPTGLPAVCMNATSCFDNVEDAASATPNAVTLIPPLPPGASQTIVVKAPVVEGVYNFISDVPGDDAAFLPDGGVSGDLTGDFVLM